MNLKQKISLTTIGAFSGFLSSVLMPESCGIRGLLFGAFLTWAALGLEGAGTALKFQSLVGATWRPALAAGILTSFFPMPQNIEFGMNGSVWRQAIAGTVNCLWFIPCLAYLYQRHAFFPALWRMSLAGLLSAVVRMLGLINSPGYMLLAFVPFLMGTLPFIIIWFGSLSMARRWFLKHSRSRVSGG